jgi:hypothetical protein
MQVKSYTDLKALIQALAGVSSFTTEEDSKILSFVNRRAAEAYNLSPSWARYLVSSEERKIFPFSISNVTQNTQLNQAYENIGAATYASGIGYDVYRGVTDTSCFLYKTKIATGLSSYDAWLVSKNATQLSTGASPSGGTALFYSAEGFFNDNPSNITDWVSAESGDVISVNAKILIPYSQSGKPTVGEFIRIHKNQAFLNNSSLEYDFFVDAEGANILNIANPTDGSAFITYKKELPIFTADSTDLPLEFFYFVAHAAYADFLRMDGQHGKALTEEQIAKNYLDIELEKIDIRSNNNSINHKFSTYVNRQSR